MPSNIMTPFIVIIHIVHAQEMHGLFALTDSEVETQQFDMRKT